MSDDDLSRSVIINVYEDVWVGLLPGIRARSGVSGVPSGFSSDERMGIDIIDMDAETSFPLHTHPGAHILFILEGEGTVTIDDHLYVTRPGDCYFVQGNTVHAVGARQHHKLLAIGFPHVSIHDPHRMELADQQFAERHPEFAQIYAGADDAERRRLLAEFQRIGRIPSDRQADE